jgi:hypothetical protein
MKKVFMVIALAAMGLTVIPQVHAQDMAKAQQLSEEANRIDAQAKARGGNFTAQELQRLQQIQQEIMQAMGMAGQPVPNPQSAVPQQAPARQPQQSPQAQQGIVRVSYPGATAGQPPASAFTRYGINNWTPPSLKSKYGETVSYKREGDKLSVYISKNCEANDYASLASEGLFTEEEIKTVINSLARAAGVTVSMQGANFAMGFDFDKPDPQRKSTRSNTWIANYTIIFNVRAGGAIGLAPYINVGNHTMLADYRFIEIAIEARADEYDPRQRD